jgi:hypothetical protein
LTQAVKVVLTPAFGAGFTVIVIEAVSFAQGPVP